MITEQWGPQPTAAASIRHVKAQLSVLPRRLTIFRRRVDVQIQTVLTLILNVCGHRVQVIREPYGHHDLWHRVVDVLGAHGHELGGVPDSRPGGGLIRGHEALFPHRRGSVGDPEVLIDGSEDLAGDGDPEASQFPELGGHSRVEFLACCFSE